VSLLMMASTSAAMAEQAASKANGGLGLSVGMGEKYNRVNL